MYSMGSIYGEGWQEGARQRLLPLCLGFIPCSPMKAKAQSVSLGAFRLNMSRMRREVRAQSS